MANYDAIIIGTGQVRARLWPGGWLAAGMEGRDHRTQTVRRHVREHRLHPDQDVGRERLRGTRCRAAPPITA